MKLGVCYYPEQWPQERWSEDARLMREAGLKLVRITDFAWSLMEPREGEFTWDWLDRVIETLAAEDLQVILCTPTASPPPWLAKSYPDILHVDEQGRRRRIGSRRHYCVNSPTYQQHTRRIVSAMAARYGEHPAVVGWQIDNELGCHFTGRCYCENCTAGFRTWLAAKYGTIEALNAAWGNVFWSQVYTDWSEIEPPNLTVAGPNPSHVLDYDRFSSAGFVSYVQLQLSVLRPHITEHQIVTTNYMSQFSELDYYEIASLLDLITMSSYPTGHAESNPSLYTPGNFRPSLAYDVGDPYITGMGMTLMRGYKQYYPFWVMEQQCGNVNWGVYNPGVRPGTVRLWTWQALSSGAEAVIYFRWRAGLYAQEQMHSGLLHHDGSADVGYADLHEMLAEQIRLAEIASLPPEARIAILLDFESLWALRVQPHRPDMEYMRQIFLFYRALQRLGLPADIVSPGGDLTAYRLVVAPAAYIATKDLTRTLQTFAEAGGTVLLGVRSGFKTVDNHVTDRPLPGFLSDLAGITVQEWHSLPPDVSYDFSSAIPGLDGPATVWAEALHPIQSAAAWSEASTPDFSILAHYTSGPFSSKPALVEHRVGSGRVNYLGWYPTDRQAEILMLYLASTAGITPTATLPEGVVASQHGPYVVLLNFTDEPQITAVRDQDYTVGPRDVMVVRLES
ncbi:MAG TPA: beta-galactosidase [Anaerolineales bacterium]|nr:beta-galactosidase [Anaerolineales bacterium]